MANVLGRWCLLRLCFRYVFSCGLSFDDSLFLFYYTSLEGGWVERVAFLFTREICIAKRVRNFFVPFFFCSFFFGEDEALLSNGEA